MNKVVFVREDLVKVEKDADGKSVVLAWGDPVEVLGHTKKRTRVRVHGRGAKPFTGTVRRKLATQPQGVLKLAMVDCQQGDAMVLETPEGRVLFIDGGDNELFARYAAARFRGTFATGLPASSKRSHRSLF